MLKEITDQTNCTTCAYSREFRESPTSLTKQHRCMRLPPTVIGIPVGASAGQIQMNIQSMFPPVHAKMICGEFTSIAVKCVACDGTGQEPTLTDSHIIGCRLCGGSGLQTPLRN